jgi:hypothetical protein
MSQCLDAMLGQHWTLLVAYGDLHRGFGSRFNGDAWVFLTEFDLQYSESDLTIDVDVHLVLIPHPTPTTLCFIAGSYGQCSSISECMDLGGRSCIDGKHTSCLDVAVSSVVCGHHQRTANSLVN